MIKVLVKMGQSTLTAVTDGNTDTMIVTTLVISALKEIFESVKNPHIYLCTFYLPAYQPAGWPAVRPICTRFNALKTTLNNRLLCPIYETAILKMIIPLCHGNSFVLLSNAFFSIH